MTVLERQQEARMKWQLQLEQREGEKDGFGGSELGELSFMANADYKEMGFERFLMNVGDGGESMFGEVVNIGNPVKPQSGTRNGWPDLSCFEMENLGFPGGLGSEMNNYAVSRTSSCAPLLTEEMMEAAVAAVAIDSDELSLREKGEVNYSVERESSKKRKPEKMESTKIQEDNRKKKIRQSTEDENSKITIQSNNNSSSSSKSRTRKDKNNSSRETSVCTSKGNSKASEIPRTDYIHVRAHRGQATDSHSLAERARRERISERMKYLQELVPGCNKITGKARMLDEIINYVQSLQRQVEFLSKKLASLNPRLDFSIGNLFCKEMFPPYMANLPTIETASEISEADYLQFNPVQIPPSCSGLEIGIGPNANSQRTVNTPDASIPSVYFDPSCLTHQVQPNLN